MTNTGNVNLSWSVTDNLIADLACPRLGLIRPGGSLICQAGAVATPGQYTNIGTVQGTSPSGRNVTDSDPANYFGVQGGIELKKFTNGEDADTAPGPFIAVGAPVTWTYRVTNTGNGALADIVVSDDRGVAVSCPGATLAVGASMTCTGTGTAQAGQYTNDATVTGSTAVGEPVSASDPSNYYGATPGIHLEKSTNGDDADAAPGPAIRVGDPVTWTFTVYNTGNTPLTGITVTDDHGVTVSCPSATLAVGAQMECTASGTATLGQYENTATVVGTDAAGTQLSDSDPSHYFGVVSGIEREEVHERRGRRHPARPGARPRRGRHLDVRGQQHGQHPDHAGRPGGRRRRRAEPGERRHQRRRATRPDRDVDVLRDGRRHRRAVPEHRDGVGAGHARGPGQRQRPVALLRPAAGTPAAQAARAVAAGPGWRAAGPSSRWPSARCARGCGREPRCGSRCGCTTPEPSRPTGCGCAIGSPPDSPTHRREARG